MGQSHSNSGKVVRGIPVEQVRPTNRSDAAFQTTSVNTAQVVDKNEPASPPARRNAKTPAGIKRDIAIRKRAEKEMANLCAATDTIQQRIDTRASFGSLECKVSYVDGGFDLKQRLLDHFRQAGFDITIEKTCSEPLAHIRWD